MISLVTPDELLTSLAASMRERRVAQGLTQVQLSEQANVSLSVLRKFERTGKISLESFVKIGFVLGIAEALLDAVSTPTEKGPSSIDELMSGDTKPPRKYAYSPRKKKV